MKQYRKTSFKQFDGTEAVQKDETIVIESSIDLWVENMQIVSFNHSHGLEKEMVLGYLISNGILDSINDIESIEFEDAKCLVSVKSKSAFVARFLGVMANPLSNLPQLTPSSIETSCAKILETTIRFWELQKVHELTGGVHAALITDLKSSEYVFAEDVGRFNAVDKTIGLALESKYDISNCLLLVSGRLTSGMVSKGIRSGIRIMASLAVATDLGIQIAVNSGMTLLGSLNEKAFWIYNDGIVTLIMS